MCSSDLEALTVSISIPHVSFLGAPFYFPPFCLVFRHWCFLLSILHLPLLFLFIILRCCGLFLPSPLRRPWVRPPCWYETREALLERTCFHKMNLGDQGRDQEQRRGEREARSKALLLLLISLPFQGYIFLEKRWRDHCAFCLFSAFVVCMFV